MLLLAWHCQRPGAASHFCLCSRRGRFSGQTASSSEWNRETEDRQAAAPSLGAGQAPRAAGSKPGSPRGHPEVGFGPCPLPRGLLPTEEMVLSPALERSGLGEGPFSHPSGRSVCRMPCGESGGEQPGQAEPPPATCSLPHAVLATPPPRGSKTPPAAQHAPVRVYAGGSPVELGEIHF